MNKIVYAALLIGLTSTAASAQQPTTLTCTGTASQACTDAMNAYNNVMGIPAMITAVADEASSGSTGSAQYQQAAKLLSTSPMSNFMNYVNNCTTTPPASGTPQAAACTSAIAAQKALSAAVAQLNSDLQAQATNLNTFAGEMKDQQNDVGMLSLVTLVADSNGLDSAVTTAAAIPIPSGPTMYKKSR